MQVVCGVAVERSQIPIWSVTAQIIRQNSLELVSIWSSADQTFRVGGGTRNVWSAAYLILSRPRDLAFLDLGRCLTHINRIRSVYLESNDDYAGHMVTTPYSKVEYFLNIYVSISGQIYQTRT